MLANLSSDENESDDQPQPVKQKKTKQIENDSDSLPDSKTPEQSFSNLEKEMNVLKGNSKYGKNSTKDGKSKISQKKS